MKVNNIQWIQRIEMEDGQVFERNVFSPDTFLCVLGHTAASIGGHFLPSSLNEAILKYEQEEFEQDKYA